MPSLIDFNQLASVNFSVQKLASRENVTSLFCSRKLLLYFTLIYVNINLFFLTLLYFSLLYFTSLLLIHIAHRESGTSGSFEIKIIMLMATYFSLGCRKASLGAAES